MLFYQFGPLTQGKIGKRHALVPVGQGIQFQFEKGTGNVHVVWGTIDNTGTTNSVLTFGQNNAGGTFSGVVQDSGTSTLALVKTGTGITTLSGTANTYEGGTTINNGFLRVQGDGSLGAVPVAPTVNITIRDGGVLQNNNSTVNLNANRTINLANGEGRIRAGWSNQNS